MYLTRRARATLARLDASRREALTDGFRRVGWELLSSAEQVTVEVGWARRTWPRRRYPQQRYPKTVKYVFDHPQIIGMRLIHGVVSHPAHRLPFDHAWMELPGDVVFDGVVQTFFTHVSRRVRRGPGHWEVPGLEQCCRLRTQAPRALQDA